jgi:hypothetical protein
MIRLNEEGCTMIVKTARMVILAGVLALTMAATLPASAKGAAVTRHGSCSANSHWKLKLSPDDARLEVQFEVDSNVNGQIWHVRILKNGSQILSGDRMTHAPSGSFEVRKLTSNPAGRDTFQARAVNARSGETCVGTASI